MVELFKHQKEAVEYFSRPLDDNYKEKHRAWLLADGPRVGKTLSAIAIDDRWRDNLDEEVKPTLIVCPKSVIDVWVQALYSYYPDLINLDVSAVDFPLRGKFRGALLAQQDNQKAGYRMSGLPIFYVCNYETLATEFEALSKVKWFHIIVDECHNVKGRDTQRSKALKKLKCEIRGATSGTPADNKPEDMWNILNWLLPKAFSSYWRFIDQCFDTYTHPKKGFKIIKGVNSEALKDHYWPLLENVYLRRKMADVRDNMPAVTYQEIPVKMSTAQAKAYIEVEEDNLSELEDLYDATKTIDLLPAYTVELHNRLQQLSIGECVVREELVFDPELNWEVPKHKLYLKQDKSPKLDKLVEYAKEGGEPLVVFCQHNDTAIKTVEQLNASKVPAIRYTGEVTQEKAFMNGDVQVIVGTYGKMREGINLAREDGGTVCFIDRAGRTKWNEQAEWRVDNINNSNPINIVDFVAYIDGRKEPTIDQLRKARFTKKDEGIELVTSKPQTV